MSGCVVTVLYPQSEDATFNLDYYLKTHMPMVLEKWGPSGMTGWTVNKYKSTADGSATPYSIEAVLHFPSTDKFQAAVTSPAAGDIMGDIPNFSNKQPVLIVGDTVGKS